MSLLDKEGQGKGQKYPQQDQAAPVGTVAAQVEAEEADPEEPRVRASSRPRLDQWGDNGTTQRDIHLKHGG